LIDAAVQAAPQTTALALCEALDIPRASYYRRIRPCGPKAPRPPSHRALAPEEKTQVLAHLNAERFQDKAPPQVYAILLDEGIYCCSLRTFYRILDENDQVRERRALTRHPSYQKPELLATGPNQIWCWDITKLKGPGKYSHLHLYVILDLFSRYVVGWMVAERESADLAECLIGETLEKEGIQPGQLTLHADRGSAMTSKPVAQLLSDLGVGKTHSRPHCSNDNAFSESQFKTMKYSNRFPQRFGSREDASAFGQEFFLWYNTEHRHSGIAYLTPETVHHGRAEQVLSARNNTLAEAAKRHPQRFKRGQSASQSLPTGVWINPPKREIQEPEKKESKLEFKVSQNH
jgi:putative transposase